MADKTWKRVERQIAKLLGGRRRGADTSATGRIYRAGLPDVILPDCDEPRRILKTFS